MHNSIPRLKRFGLLMISLIWTPPLWAEILESFEGRHYWQIAPWGDEASFGVSKEEASEGEKSLEIHFASKMANRGKGIVLERDLSSLGREFNLLTIDVFNKGPAKLSVALAVEADEYYESVALPLEKDWNKNLTFALASKTFKSKTSNWKYQTSVNLTSPPKKMSLLFYREGAAEGTFFVDHLRIEVDAGHAEVETPVGAPGAIIERSKKHHYRPKGLPIEIFIRS